LALGPASSSIHFVEALPDRGRDALPQVDLPYLVLPDENDGFELGRSGSSPYTGGLVLDYNLQFILAGDELPEHESTERVIVLSLPI
jgi:hypothetical protein